MPPSETRRRSPPRSPRASGTFPQWAAAAATELARTGAFTVPAPHRSRRALAAGLWRPVTAVIAALGVAFGVVVMRAAHGADANRVHDAADAALVTRSRELERETAALVEVAHAVRGLHEASADVSRAAFARFTREARMRHPSIRAIGWAPRAGGGHPVRWVEPRADGEFARGLDLARSPSSAAAVAETTETGAAAISAPWSLPGVAGPELLTWIVLAVPADDAATDAGATPPVAIVALAVAFRPLLQRVEQVASAADPTHPLALSLADAGEASDARVLAATDVGIVDPVRVGRPVHVLGRPWLLAGAAEPDVFAAARGPSPFLLGAAAMLLWELVNGALVALARSWRGLALDRQARTVHRVLRGLTDAVFVTDRGGRVCLANDAARRLGGAGVQGADGLDGARRALATAFAALAPSPAADPTPLDRALRGITVDALEFELAPPPTGDVPTGDAPTGSRALTLEARPLHDDTGAVEGGVVVVRDVTARRRADAVARELHARDAELELAARIQRHLYPERCPAVPGLELAGAVVSASATCGDYYDVLPRPDGSVLVAIGDVSGHGLGPALVMAEVRATIRSMVEAGLGPVEVLRHVDAVLARDHQGELFVTMLLVVIAPWTRSIAYANAGHVPGLLVDARGGLAARLIGSGPPLGLGEGRQYRLGTAGPMASGDVLVLVTDGATECPNQADEPFDEAGVFEAVRANQDASAEEIVASLRDRLRAYGGGRHDRDDVTLVIVKASAG